MEELQKVSISEQLFSTFAGQKFCLAQYRRNENFNPECKRERGFINQLYIELGKIPILNRNLPIEIEKPFHVLVSVVLNLVKIGSLFHNKCDIASLSGRGEG